MSQLNRPNRSRLRQSLITVVAFGMLIQVSTQPGLAQSGEDVVKGLLRALIESKLDRSQRSNKQPQAPPPKGLKRGNLSPQQLTAKMNKVRPIVASFAQESATLGALLRRDSRRSFELRQHLPDVMRLQASATVLKQRAASQNHHRPLMDDFRRLNGDWSTLSYHLGQYAGLSSQTSACIGRLSQLDAQYCGLLGIQEQFDNRELTQAAYTLTTYVRDLVEDVQNLPYSHRGTQPLLRRLGRVTQQTEYFASLASQGSRYQTVVTEYQTTFRIWRDLEDTLSDLKGPVIARDIRRIQRSHRTIHRLLRLEIGVNKAQVLHLIHEIDHDMVELFRAFSLEQLMALPDGGSIPEAADTMYGTIQNIDDLVRRDQDAYAINEAWVYADEAWHEFSFYVKPITTGRVPVLLNSISDNIHALQQTLGISIEYDCNVLVGYAASLEQMSERLAAGLRQWQTHPGQHDRTLVRKSEQMVHHFHTVEQSLERGTRGRHNLIECDKAIALWHQIRPALKTCNTDERELFDHIVATLTPEVVRLRTMLDE